MRLGIDMKTADKDVAIEQLSALGSVMDVIFGGIYREDPAYCQVFVETVMSESELDDWMYENAKFDYVGVFVES